MDTATPNSANLFPLPSPRTVAYSGRDNSGTPFELYLQAQGQEEEEEEKEEEEARECIKELEKFLSEFETPAPDVDMSGAHPPSVSIESEDQPLPLPLPENDPESEPESDYYPEANALDEDDLSDNPRPIPVIEDRFSPLVFSPSPDPSVNFNFSDANSHMPPPAPRFDQINQFGMKMPSYTTKETRSMRRGPDGEMVMEMESTTTTGEGFISMISPLPISFNDVPMGGMNNAFAPQDQNMNVNPADFFQFQQGFMPM